MFGRRIKLFKIFGFSVYADLSWSIIVLLIVWSLSAGLFPFYYEDLPTGTYWMMGGAGALGLFFSVVFHELSHSLVARRYGLEMRGITLFVFGGVAEMQEDPKTPKVELLMSLAGPASSLVLAGIFYLGLNIGQAAGWPAPVRGVVGYLAVINAVLALFNLVPAFPLDGGRVFRSILWYWKGNIQWATKVAAQAGTAFGFVLIFFGVVSILAGNFVGGMWWVFLGLFLRGASRMSRTQLMAKMGLSGQRVSRFMKTDPITVHPSMHIDELVENYIYRHHYKMFPVVDGGDHLEGYVSTEEVKRMPREQWHDHSVGELVRRPSPENTIGPEDDAAQALARMNQARASRLMVVENDRLVGIVSLKDLLDFLSLKFELEGGKHS